MIRLEITDPATGSILVPHLSADLSFDVVRENPLFNRRGDYTYDIDISLRDPHNRAIYQHIDRLTAASRPKNRHARLLCDGHIVAEGTEVILKKEADTLKIQILAGNSEMNYLTADENLRIREMDFGSIPQSIINPGHARSVSPLIYPATNYVFPMLCKGSSTNEGYDNKYQMGSWKGSNENGIYYDDDTELWPQPFLLYYVEKFIQLLGYKITRNDLRNDKRWTHLLLISGYRTLSYAKMLPDWTASEFVTEIERFFNCIILTSKDAKTAQIICIPEFYSSSGFSEINDILDEFTTEYDGASENYTFANDNLKYQLPGNNYYRYKSLPDDVIKGSTLVSTPIAPKFIITHENTDWKIYTTIVGRNQFVVTKDRDSEGNVIRKRWWYVNEFHHEAPEDTQWQEMRIIPAHTFIRFYRPADIYYNPDILCGIVSAYPQYYDNSEAGDFTATIQGGGKENAATTMQVAFYTGIIQTMKADRETGMLSDSGFYYGMLQTKPFSVTDYLFTRVDGTYIDQQDFSLSNELWPDYLEYTLALDGENGRYQKDYNRNKMADLTNPYTIRFRTSVLLDPITPFLIRGRLFVCQQLKYKYTDGRQDPIVEGTFYPYI